jgi:tetratricopeptide (TPR) repeat protein
MEALSASDPGNAGWRRDLSVSYERIGDILKAQGDGAGALKSYRDSLAIREKLSASDPGNARWRRDLSLSYIKVGDILVAQGDRDGALKAYRDSLAIMEALSASDPGNAQWRRDVAVSYWSMAEVEPRNAREHVLKARAILKQLSDSGRLDPVDAKWLDEVDQRLKALDAPAAAPPAARPAKSARVKATRENKCGNGAAFFPLPVLTGRGQGEGLGRLSREVDDASESLALTALRRLLPGPSPQPSPRKNGERERALE